MTAPDITRARGAAHSMLCYDTDASLVEAVVEHAGRMLVAGGGLVVIATPDHNAGIETRLASAGFDVAALVDEGRIVVFDAVATRATLLAGDGPVDAAVLDAVVGDVVRTTAARWGSALVFGEMVALLWADGLVNQALELETLWSDLADEVHFEVLCAYPAAAGLDGDDGNAFERVCSLHDSTSGFRNPTGDSVLRRFDARPTSVRDARRFVAEALADVVDAEQVHVAMLVTSELAGNAVLHAGTPFLVAVEHSGGVVRVSVADGVPAHPVPRAPDAAALSGRGLRLVEALSHRWGSDDCTGGKIVWAEIASSGATTPSPTHPEIL